MLALENGFQVYLSSCFFMKQMLVNDTIFLYNII